MEEIVMPEADPGNWKYAVGFVIGVIVTLIIIVVLANKYGKEPSPAASVPPPSDAGATVAPSEPQLALPPTAVPEAPAGAETYMPAPF